MKGTLFESESAAVRARNVTAALLLALSTGCANGGGREPGAASASKAVTTERAASASADAADVRRVRVSGDGAEPSIAAAADGSVYVTWVAHRPGKEADVWLLRFDREGKPVGGAVRVNPADGEATAWRGDPPDVAAAPDGTVYVAWTARVAGADHATTLYLSASRDGGQSFGTPVKVNDDARDCVHGMHSLAVSGGGRVYVAWLDERDIEPREADPSKAPSHMHTESNRVVYFASSADGGRTFAPNRRVATEACPCCKTSLAVGDDGRVYVGWRQVLPGDFRHIAVASSDDRGQTFSPASIVSDDRWELQGCPVSGPALAAGAGGSLHVLWYTAGEAGKPGLYWSESVDGARTFSPRRMLAETSSHGTPALLKGDGGTLTAVWEGVDGAAPAAVKARLDGERTDTTAAVVAGGGELPAAAEAAGQLFVAYITKEDEGHGVWLLKSRKD
jgi:hypothetical protein